MNPDIPDWLSEIIEKLHAKDREQRFQSASEVADLLGKHLAHLQQPKTAPKPPPLGYRSPAAQAHRRRWLRRCRGRGNHAVDLLCATAAIAGIPSRLSTGAASKPSENRRPGAAGDAAVPA